MGEGGGGNGSKECAGGDCRARKTLRIEVQLAWDVTYLSGTHRTRHRPDSDD